MSEYKPGDRVKVAFEAEVTHTDEDGIRVVDRNRTPNVFAWVFPEHIVEKLAPPEPKWVYGAVVKVDPYVPAVYDGETWRTPMGTPHSADIYYAWENGTLQVIWNGSQPGE